MARKVAKVHVVGEDVEQPSVAMVNTNNVGVSAPLTVVVNWSAVLKK